MITSNSLLKPALQALRRRGPLNTADLSTALGVGPAATREILGRLAASELVTRDGQRWRLTAKAAEQQR